MTLVQMRQRRLTASFLAPHPGHFTFEPMRFDGGESDDGLKSDWLKSGSELGTSSIPLTMDTCVD